jgi:hypothetical protein
MVKNGMTCNGSTARSQEQALRRGSHLKMVALRFEKEFVRKTFKPFPFGFFFYLLLSSSLLPSITLGSNGGERKKAGQKEGCDRLFFVKSRSRSLRRRMMMLSPVPGKGWASCYQRTKVKPACAVAVAVRVVVGA